MEETVKAPELAKIVYGEGATAGERMKRWAEAFEGWLEEQERRNSVKRRMEDRHAWKDFWTCRRKLPWEVGEQDVLAWVEQLRLRRLGAKTIHRRLFALEGFYRSCPSGEVDPALGPGFNPLSRVKRPSIKYLDQPTTLTIEETQALLKAVDRGTSLVGMRDYALILAALRTGREIKKILNLKWEEQSAMSRCYPWPGMHATGSSDKRDVEAAIEAYLRAAGRWEGMQAGEYIFAPLADPLGQPPTGKGRSGTGAGRSARTTPGLRWGAMPAGQGWTRCG